MFELFNRPTIFAHRGARAYAPENTLAAFNLAVQQGADGIEFDVQLSADGKVVVIHDKTVDRTTDGRGKISELHLDTLKQLDAGAFFDSAFRGERIPTLSEVFQTVGQKILMNIELKNEYFSWDSLPDRVAEIVNDHKVEQRVIFSSYNPIALIKIKGILPKIPCALLAHGGAKGKLECSWGYKILGCQALNPPLSSVTEALVQKVHASGKRIYPYTANIPDEINRLLTLGVDGIITDDPVLANRLVNEWRQTSDPLKA
jgi:glycerophosphoryl diester phosphodiesterase